MPRSTAPTIVDALCTHAPHSTPVDRDHPPAALEAIDPRQGQRVDNKTQCAIGCEIERDGKHRADGTGMRDEDDVARGQRREACARTGNLVDKTLAAGQPVTRRPFPKGLVGVAELGDEIVVPPSGPGPKILFAKVRLPDRIEPEGSSGFPRSARRTANGESIFRQSRPERGEGCGIADVRRRVRTMDDAARSVDRGVPDQPDICLNAHR